LNNEAMTISQIGMFSCAGVALCIIARIAFLCSCRTPVLARVTRHDYDAAERRFEWGADFCTTGDPTEWNPFRGVWARTSYNYQGVEYRNDVLVIVGKGTEPERALQIWINPADPNRATAQGPEYWFFWLLLTSVFLIAFWQLPF
jgi:hypothetical protein